MKKIEIEKLPELTTSVAMHGSPRSREVGGPICVGIAVSAVLMYIGSQN
ncbi:MAG: hypothetical protein ACFBQW_08810 [Sphingomonadaceae bacterium]